MWCMCGGCEKCVGAEWLHEQAQIEADAEAEEIESAAVNAWLEFDSLCRSFGERAPGTAKRAGERALQAWYDSFGLMQ